MSGEALIMIGKAPKGCKHPTAVLVTRAPRSKWWRVVCFGQKSHYRPDGGCEHTDATVARLRPERVRPELVRVVPFGEGKRS